MMTECQQLYLSICFGAGNVKFEDERFIDSLKYITIGFQRNSKTIDIIGKWNGKRGPIVVSLPLSVVNLCNF